MITQKSQREENKETTVKSQNFKGTLSDLRQFLATESPVEMMKNAFYFFLKALFLLELFKLLF